MVAAKPLECWKPPAEGYAKLNSDGAYGADGSAGAGMALRDHDGSVIFVASRELRQCRDATEAEILAIEEGLRLSLHWTTLPIVVETDCSEAVDLIKESTPNTSAYAFKISEIRELLKERETRVVWVNRNANYVSHELAKLGRVKHRTAVWLRNFPEETAEAMTKDCNPLAN